MLSKLLSFILFVFSVVALSAQNCTAPGQNPGTAFPVCGTNVFTQNNVPICGVRDLPVPCNDGAQYQDKNPFWYKFTCFTPGTLSFTITPLNLSDDYDWQLFDITGRNAADVYTNASLFVCCNWSANPGVTGTNTTATSNISCAGNTPNYTRAPMLQLGHEYLLLVSHYTNSQSGYRLSFAGTTGTNGTASITDTTQPSLKSIVPSCDGKTLTVNLNKRMRCSSLTTSGSDFTLSPFAGNSFAAVSGAGCSTGFDTDSITIGLQNPLAAGTYQFIAQAGTDGNTMLDNCSTAIPTGNSLRFIMAPNQPTPFDSLSPVGCAPNTLQVVFRKPVRCNSVAADASDFQLIGTPTANITSVTAACGTNGTSTTLLLNLSQPLQAAGNYQLVLRSGTDGNTIIDECGQETPANATISFTTKDTVSAHFTYQLFLDCTEDSVAFTHDGRNGVNSWKWNFDDGRASQQQNPMMRYTVFGAKTAQLIVSNGTCTDTTNASFVLDNYLEARFGSPAVLCPRDTAFFTDSSLGKIKSWQWTFGNGSNSIRQNPPAQFYPPTNLQTTYQVQLVVTDSLNCSDTLSKNLLVVNNCYIDVPTAFTPNGDGLNDYLYPLNAYKADHLLFRVYNRMGQLVWQTTDWTRKWDGTVNGKVPSTSTYVWYLTYTHKETRQRIQQHGTVVLIR